MEYMYFTPGFMPMTAYDTRFARKRTMKKWHNFSQTAGHDDMFVEFIPLAGSLSASGDKKSNEVMTKS